MTELTELHDLAAGAESGDPTAEDGAVDLLNDSPADPQDEDSGDALSDEPELDAGSSGAGSGDGTGDSVFDADGNFSLPRYMERAYLDYAISVVKGRALPDCRDGQKPVQRRFLYAMRDMGLSHTSKHIKSARVVGDVMGKYHPHGDSSIYDAMVRNAQNFMLRYPLIDGQGNFGSRDGDGAAAMRYTECRLTAISDLLLSEIDRGTVDFKPNYDGAFNEPVVLPARLPMLLLNGTSGVAVGYAAEIPSHNLREVAAAAVLLIDKPEASDEEIFAILGAPDFPGGGQIISPATTIREAYLTGKGGVRMRARWRREELARGQWRIVVYELPHGVSTAHVLEDIETATNPQPKAGKKEISQDAKNIKLLMMSVLDAARDESFEEEPVRLVLEPKTSKITEDDLMSALLARTRLESGVPINLVSIARDGNPHQMTLRKMLSDWIGFRFETVERRIRHRLDEALRRLHILEGRMLAFLRIEEVIRIIRESEDPKLGLMEKIGLTDVQAEDILEIRLRQLARLEGIKIEREAEELRKEAAALQHLLDDRKAFTRMLVKEIEADAKKYGDDRRTLVEAVQPIRAADVVVADEPTTLLISAGGWLRTRQGHAIDRSTVAWKQGDVEFAVLETRTTWPLILLDSKGRAYSIAVSEIPGGRGDGVPWTSLIDIQDGAKIVHVFSNDPGASYLFTNSRSYGFITQVLELVGTRKSGKAFMTLDFNEKILKPVPVTDMTHTVAACSHGPKESRLVLFPVGEMKVMAKGLGVIVMVIEEGEELVSVDLLPSSAPTAIKVTADKLVVPIKGEDLNKFLTRRARKGCQLSKKVKPLSVALA